MKTKESGNNIKPNKKPLRALASEFVKEQDTSETTERFHMYILDRFFKYIVTNKIQSENIKRVDIITYKRSLISDNKSALTIDKYLGLVRRFFSWLNINGYYPNIAEGVHSVKRHKGYRTHYLKKHQVIELLSDIDTTTVKGLRDYAMINLMVYTGLRRCEVQRLTLDDIEHDSMNIIRKGHVEKETIGVNETVIDPINDYLVRMNLSGDSALFVSLSANNRNNQLSLGNISSIVKQYIKRIDNDKHLTCHSLRHTFAINSLLAGATIFEVQNALGHESAETTKIYLSMLEGETKRLNPAHNKLKDFYRNTG